MMKRLLSISLLLGLFFMQTLSVVADEDKKKGKDEKKEQVQEVQDEKKSKDCKDDSCKKPEKDKKKLKK